MAIEIQVLRARCISTSSCARAAAGTFALDEAQIAIVINPEGDPEADVVAAAEACPTGAISVFKDGTRIA